MIAIRVFINEHTGHADKKTDTRLWYDLYAICKDFTDQLFKDDTEEEYKS